VIVLALDSSADLVGAAVLRDGAPLAERTRRAPRPSSEGLLPIAESVLSDGGVTLNEVDLVAVATGPGSFNGIRGGIATAEGLAFALGITAVGVPTLDALAYCVFGRAPLVCAVLPAGRGQFYGAAYEGTWSGWRRRGDYSLAALEEHLGVLPPGTLLCGQLSEEAAREATRRGIEHAPPHATFSRVTAIGVIGVERLGAGDDVAVSLHPLYLRRPGITQSTRPLSAVNPGGDRPTAR